VQIPTFLRRKRAAAALAVMAVTAAGGGAALAADSESGSSSGPAADRNRFEGEIADRLGVSRDDLREAFAAEIRQRMRSGEGPPGGPHGAVVEGHAPPFIEATADYIGISLRELGNRLRDGKSLAQIAEAEGKSVDGLKDALVDDFSSNVDEIVNSTGPGPDLHRDPGPGGPGFAIPLPPPGGSN
jgi:hypothetical protein